MKSLIALSVLLLPAVAHAGHCRSFFHHQQAIVAVPYVAYSVGDNIRLEALAEKVAPLVAQKLQAQTAPLPVTAPPSILSTKCARCHSGPQAKGGFDLASISHAQAYRVMEILGPGRDVPDAMKALVASLKPEDKGALMDAVMSLPIAQPAGDLQ